MGEENEGMEGRAGFGRGLGWGRVIGEKGGVMGKVERVGGGMGNGGTIRMFDALWVGSQTGKKLVSWCTNLGDAREMKRNSKSKFKNRRKFRRINNEFRNLEILKFET